MKTLNSQLQKGKRAQGPSLTYKGSQQSVDVRFSGLLTQRVIKNDASGVVLSAQLSETSLSQGGVESDQAALLESPFLIKLTSQGVVKAVHFLPELPERNQLLISSLIQHMQLSLNGDFEQSWASTEVINDVSYLTSYSRGQEDVASGVVSVTKRYSSPKNVKKSMLELSPSIKAMSTSAQVALDGSGLRSMTLNAEQSLTHHGKHIGSSTTSLSVTQVSRRDLQLPESEQALMASPMRKQLEALSGYNVSKDLLDQVSPLSSKEILDAYISIMSEDLNAAAMLLQAYVVRHPERCSRLLEMIISRRSELKKDQMSSALNAFVEVGHTQAQEALAEQLFSEVEDVQGFITMSLYQLKAPSEMIIDRLWEARNLPRLEGKILRHIMSTAMGSLGSVEKGLPARTAQALAYLSADIKSPAHPANVRMSLDGLTNIRDAELVLPLARPFFNSENPFDRKVAFTVFSFLPGDEVFNEFARHFNAESDTFVLERAAAIARRMPSSNSRTLWASDQLFNSPLPAVQVNAVKILGRDIKNFPENENILRTALDTVRNRDVRREIYIYITPKATR
jgi:hypothetical protein